jgi:hypothetical protein
MFTMLIDDAIASGFVKPPVRMVGEDGNVFLVIGRVRNALVKAGRVDLEKEFVARATAEGSTYDKVLAMTFDYCDVDGEQEADVVRFTKHELLAIWNAITGDLDAVPMPMRQAILDKLGLMCEND